MPAISDYKSYKKFEPEYADWKYKRELADAKRIKYLEENPDKIDQEDVQRGKALLRAIDTMDEFSQQRAENTEVATESIISLLFELTMFAGGALGVLATRMKPFQNYIAKHFPKTNNTSLYTVAMLIGGGIASSLAGFPLFSWGAKKEVEASQKGRFEAMREDLNDAKLFAVLSPEQEIELEERIKDIKVPKEKKHKGLSESITTVKELVSSSKVYKAQKKEFEERLNEDLNHFDDKLSEDEIEKAKKDKMLLTNLVEKIDIASQDYAENVELATSTLTTSVFAFGALFTLAFNKLVTKLKINNMWSKVPAVLSFAAMMGASIFSASIQKQASRVGRFKIKQELSQNPANFAYADENNINSIPDFEITQKKKDNIFVFLKKAWKNNKEFEKWEKSDGLKEKATAIALKEMEFTENQIKDAKRLQHNTFKTFNKVDSNSQKYSEAIEALGQGIQNPISILFTTIGAMIGVKRLNKALLTNGADKFKGVMEYIVIILLSTLPSVLINAYITKEQKKASRVASMLTIKELDDYRNFADYSGKPKLN